MWFKNLTVYRMPAHWQVSPADVEAALAEHESSPLQPSQQVGHGWVHTRDDQFAHTLNGQMLLTLQTDKKVVPSSAIKAGVAEKVKALHDETGRKPGRKQTKELAFDVMLELLPRAIPTTSKTHVWIDTVHGWVVIDTASPTRSDVAITMLVRALKTFATETLHVSKNPLQLMTDWLLADESPSGFTIDRETELRASDESKSVVRYTNHSLDIEEIKTQITSGKRCTKLALTWNDKISFVMGDGFRFRKLVSLDAITADIDTSTAEDGFDGTFTIMTGELNHLFNDLLLAFGGEAPREV
jgi:recombination associated protein RdgC